MRTPFLAIYICIFAITLSVLFSLCCIAFADSSLFYKELNLIGGYSEVDKWIGKGQTLKNSVGFEYYRKFSNEYGDFLTTDLQVRLAYDSSEKFNDAWGIEIHNAWAEYKLGYGHKVMIGHFSPAFGLEPVVDTHGTLLQTLAMKDIGFKKDWGGGLRGYLSNFDYELAAQIGSGMSIRREDGSFLLSSRIGNSSSSIFQYGVSLLYGEILKTSGMNTFPRNDLLSRNAVLKKRVGLDGQWFIGPYVFKGEVAYGENEREDVLGYLLEAEYIPPKYQNLQLSAQFQSWINDLHEKGTDDSTLFLCVSYKVNNDITIRTSFNHDFNLMNENEDNRILVQFYYYAL